MSALVANHEMRLTNVCSPVSQHSEYDKQKMLTILGKSYLVKSLLITSSFGLFFPVNFRTVNTKPSNIAFQLLEFGLARFILYDPIRKISMVQRWL